MENKNNNEKYAKTTINWSKGIFGKSVTNLYKLRNL